MINYSVNSEAIQLWVEALRSGKYKQCKGELYIKYKDAYCCLGVCRRVLNEKYERNFSSHSGTHLDDETAEFLGIHSYDQNYLIKLNDETGYNFNKIADYIEANYLK